MSSTRERPGACAGCLRRSWLLSALSASLEYRCRDRARLMELLRLSDEDLLHALAGRRRGELKHGYEKFEVAKLTRAEGVSTVCGHDHSYPPRLSDPGAPRMLNVTGEAGRFGELAAAPTVAIIGSTRASDYGMEIARSLARGLSASGVTVVGGLSDGIAVAAHAGALEVGGATVAVMPGGLDVACPARRRSLYARLRRSGCAVSELPCGTGPRRWGQLAAERIVARLAALTVVVEAKDTPGDLAGARIAETLGRTVAAVPGRVTSPISGGAHALLMDGARLVRGPADALELLCGPGSPATATPADSHAALEPRLRATLENVGAGIDTPEKLTRGGGDSGELLLALSELELMGLLARGDGGRYVPRTAHSRDRPGP
jgi:DNA processing protein